MSDEAGAAPDPGALTGPGVAELRVALTVPDFDAALAFYRDALGMAELEAWSSEDGRVVILDGGRATLELLDQRHADAVDEIEVGRPGVAGGVRFALQVPDSASAADGLESAGARRVGGPVVTPWRHRNVRLEAPDGMQLTLFTVLDEP
jgi:catechol 2,3-dioxygenase-like lactoylglutathione lyase family enzyme